MTPSQSANFSHASESPTTTQQERWLPHFVPAVACPACGDSVEPASFPLCEICEDALTTCPPLCPDCGSVTCLQPPSESVLASAIASAGTCHRPWAKINEVRSWHARYLLVGRGYSVLKAWKRKRGPLLTRKVLNADVATAEWLASLGPAATIVPIPQSYTRSWQLGGSPALHIAQWLARVAPNPSIEVHASLLRPSPHAQQAQRTSLGRVSNPIRFEVQAAPRLKERMAQKPLILVDDFMTTGATLKSAARALMRDLGPVEIHVFCLGLRPSGLRRGAQAHPCANSLKRLTDEHRSL